MEKSPEMGDILKIYHFCDALIEEQLSIDRNFTSQLTMSPCNLKSAPIQENRLSSGQSGHIMSPTTNVQAANDPGQ